MCNPKPITHKKKQLVRTHGSQPSNMLTSKYKPILCTTKQKFLLIPSVSG